MGKYQLAISVDTIIDGFVTSIAVVVSGRTGTNSVTELLINNVTIYCLVLFRKTN